jgi:hypothetical protein
VSDERPRDHVYLFAHREVPGATRRFGADIVASAAAGTLDLANVWARVGEGLPPEERVPSEGLWWRHRETPLGSAVLVGLPAPQRPTEPYFLLVLPPRVAALELGWDVVNGGWYTVLCAWDGDRHLNLGAGPDPSDPDAFVAAVVERLGAA